MNNLKENEKLKAKDIDLKWKNWKVREDDNLKNDLQIQKLYEGTKIKGFKKLKGIEIRKRTIKKKRRRRRI